MFPLRRNFDFYIFNTWVPYWIPAVRAFSLVDASDHVGCKIESRVPIHLSTYSVNNVVFGSRGLPLSEKRFSNNNSSSKDLTALLAPVYNRHSLEPKEKTTYNTNNPYITPPTLLYLYYIYNRNCYRAVTIKTALLGIENPTLRIRKSYHSETPL